MSVIEKSPVLLDRRGGARTALLPRVRGRTVLPFRSFLAWLAVSFLVSFVLVWIYVVAMPMAFLSRDYPLWIAKRTMMDECQPETVAVFGDSRAVAGIVPGVMQLRVNNYALSGSSPVETYFAVQRALRCTSRPKLVLIAHSAVKYTEDTDFWSFSARAGFLSHADIRRVEIDAARLHDPQLELAKGGLQLSPWLRDALFALRFPPIYFRSLTDGFVGLRWWHNRAALQAAVASRGQALFGQSSGSALVADEVNFGPFRAMPLTDLYFSKTLALLADRQVPVVVLTMPINHATHELTSPELASRFSRYLHDKAGGLKNILSIDGHLPCWPDSYFGDAWHFNQRGAEAYSRVLDERLQALLTGSNDYSPLDRCD